jgi:hypothetical protein
MGPPLWGRESPSFSKISGVMLDAFMNGQLEIPVDLERSSLRAPLRRAQMPVIRAFRRFIATNANHNKLGKPWTVLPILEELWHLWGERNPRVLFVDFRDKYEKSIERLRARAEKYEIRDALLFVLIQRFLDARGRDVFDAAVAPMIHMAASGMSLLLPLETNLPCVNEYVEGTLLLEFVPGKHGEAFVALKVPKFEEAKRCCVAMVFGRQLQNVRLGIYTHFGKTLYVRDRWFGPPVFTIYRLETERFPTRQPETMYLPGSYQNDAVLARPGNLCTGSQAGAGGEIRVSRDRAALSFAEDYFRNFDK